MALWITPTTDQFTDLAKTDLMRFVDNDPGLTFGNVESEGFPVEFAPASNNMLIPADPRDALKLILMDIIASDVKVRIFGQASDFRLPGGDTPIGDVLSEHAGNTGKDAYPNTTDVRIHYDVEECDGRGYEAAGTSGGTAIDVPRAAILANELGHALVFSTTGRPTGSQEQQRVWTDQEMEVKSREVENFFRTANNLPERGVNVRIRCKAGGSSSSSPCFIATAAYGSPIEPEVQFLREFRDEVLRDTRAGRRFFQRFWEQYYQISPPIAERMNDDKDLNDVIRWSMVTPLVDYLQLFLELPDRPIDDIPQDWQKYIADIQQRFERWADGISLPVDFTGLSAAEAAREIEIVLRFGRRRSESRHEYLTHLESLGQIPLQTSDREWQQIAAALRRSGRTESEIRRIIGDKLPSTLFADCESDT